MIIGICGAAGVGKDTAARYMARHRNLAIMALADPMKRICADIFGFPQENLWGESHLRNEPFDSLKGLSARRALQLLGTEFGRACYQDVWVEYLFREAKKLLETPGALYTKDRGVMLVHSDAMFSGVVIPDVRFRNEVEAIKRLGGAVVYMTRPGLEKSEWSAHTSESELLTIPKNVFSAEIVNDSSLDSLYFKSIIAIRHCVQSECCNA